MRELLTALEAATAKNCTCCTIYNWAKKGLIDIQEVHGKARSGPGTYLSFLVVVNEKFTKRKKNNHKTSRLQKIKRIKVKEAVDYEKASIKEAAKLKFVSEQTIRQWIKQEIVRTMNIAVFHRQQGGFYTLRKVILDERFEACQERTEEKYLELPK